MAANEPQSETVKVSAYCRDLQVAERALEVLLAAGITEDRVSGMARGIAVDRYLVDSAAIHVGPSERVPPTSKLARLFSQEPRFLLEGCWSVGPLALKGADHRGGQGCDELVRALLKVGYSVKDAVGVEERLKLRGGVWLALELEAAAADSVEAALTAVDGVEVQRLP